MELSFIVCIQQMLLIGLYHHKPKMLYFLCFLLINQYHFALLTELCWVCIGFDVLFMVLSFEAL